MVIKTQEKIDNLTAQEILDLTDEEIQVLSEKRRKEIQEGNR